MDKPTVGQIVLVRMSEYGSSEYYYHVEIVEISPNGKYFRGVETNEEKRERPFGHADRGTWYPTLGIVDVFPKVP